MHIFRNLFVFPLCSGGGDKFKFGVDFYLNIFNFVSNFIIFLFYVFCIESMGKFDFVGAVKTSKKPYDSKKKEFNVWRNFNFSGICPQNELLEELSKEFGEDKFSSMFKSKFDGKTYKFSEDGEPVVTEMCKITISCKEKEANQILSFFEKEGFPCEVSVVSFKSKK